MYLKRSDLAMYRVKKEREQVLEAMEAYQAERWDGFLGGYKGILTFLVASVVFSVVIYGIGALFAIEVLTVLCQLWGVFTGLVFSQCVRNQRNATAESHLRELKANYKALTKMSTELYFA